MKLSKNKVAGGVLGLLAIVSIVNTQAILKLTNLVAADYTRPMSLDGSNQSAQVVKFSTKTTENAVYKRGDKSDVILQVQKALTSKGIYKGDISGLMGPKTEKAISDFQKSNGLTVTGTLDQKTINLILNRGAGDSRDGGWNPDLSVVGSAPTLSYLQGRCNGEPQPFVRILSPWIGDQFTYLEDDVDIQIFVCDNTATSSTNTHIIEGLVSQGIDIENNAAIEGSLELVAAAFDDSDMIPYGENSWLINFTLEDDHFEPGHYAMVISSEGGYKINGTPQFGTNVYAGWVGPFEIVDEDGGEGGCAPGVTEPSVELISPFATGGYHGAYTPGQQLTVTWNTCNISNNAKVSIGLIQEDALNVQPQFIEFLTNKFGTINDGTETFTLPGMTNGTEKARIVISVTTPSYDIFAGNPLNVQDSILSDFSLGYAEFD